MFSGILNIERVGIFLEDKFSLVVCKIISIPKDDSQCIQTFYVSLGLIAFIRRILQLSLVSRFLTRLL